jgi:transcriptional regulator with XRE-family HTH domain
VLIKHNNKNKSAVGEIIKHLMSESGITEAELARQIAIPQTTINRLLLGETLDPRASTLKPIAKYFGVSVGQIIGTESLAENRIAGTFKAINRDAWSHVPVIKWTDSIAWLFRNEEYDLHSHESWTITDRKVSNTSFALLSMPSMEPMFRKNSILIIDPHAEMLDGKYVIVTLDGTNTIIRKIQIDGGTIYLKNFDTHLPTIELDKKIHRVLGIIVESKVDL